MKVVIDIEANSLVKPTKIWCIVLKDIETEKLYIFRNLTEDKEARDGFLGLLPSIDTWIGHNILGYDYPVLCDLLELRLRLDSIVDTLILSKLVAYSRQGHSIEDYGLEFGKEKIKFTDFSKWSQEMEDYCVRDVDICLAIYRRYAGMCDDPSWADAIRLEHSFQIIVNRLHDNGFYFNSKLATSLLDKVNAELTVLDEQILAAFPPRLKLIREVTPRATKHGTIARNSIPKALGNDLTPYTVDAPFCHCKWEDFNPSSHKQLIQVLNEAGWQPSDKTQTRIDVEREINRLKYKNNRTPELDLELEKLYSKLQGLQTTGWKINETNLDTLPSTAPDAARFLAKRILLESRRRTLTEWSELVDQSDNRIHGKFYGIGAWTHRMAHQQPNTANIPSALKEDGSVKLYGKEMRSLWRSSPKHLLVGVDAESIQLRIFAHYINEGEFTDALVNGKKAEKSDPHSLNQRILGSVCKTRQAAKRFIYALLLGAGIEKLAQILGCERNEAEAALGRLSDRYQGFARLKQEVIPKDARNGYFIGLDGRKVAIPGQTFGERKHLCMSGYLQNGEAIIIKRTALASVNRFHELEIPAEIVNIVHDEFVFEVPNNVILAEKVRDICCEEIERVGIDLKLHCPLKGDGSIGTNWYAIH